nr:ABC transporter permease [Maliibacterium massiliense]
MNEVKPRRFDLKGLKDNVLAVSLLSLVASLVLAGVIIACAGYSPFAAYGAMFTGAFGGMSKIADTLGTATPLILTGLAVALAMKGGVVNIGCEGQMYMGAMAAALVGAYVKGLPAPIHIAMCVLAAMIVGGLWAAIAGALKVRLGVSEVILTIMLNYIATYFTDYLATYHFKAEGMTIKTPNIMDTASLPKLYPHSRFTVGFILAIIAVLVIWWMLKKTTMGFETRALGSNPFAAETGGVNRKRQIVITMLMSGMLAGLAGGIEVLGVHQYFVKGFSPGYGFDGLAIAVLGQNNPFGVLISAIFYGALRSGATMMDRATKIPGDFVVILQALVIIFVATPAIVRALRLRRTKGGKAHD